MITAYRIWREPGEPAASAIRMLSALMEEPSQSKDLVRRRCGLEQKTLVECRKDAGLTQDYMAHELGITRSRYAQIEHDPSNITIKQARKICAVLGRAYETIIFKKFVN